MHEACNIDCTSAIELRLTGLWGTTGLQEECPNGHFVTAFKTKMSLNQGITGVRLQCNDPSQEEIHSLEHPDGSYGEFVLSCPGGYTKIKGKFHPNQPDGDNRDCTCVDMYCPETGQWHKSICEPGYFPATFQGPESCDPGQVICGIKTKVWMGDGDKTGLGSVFMRCCVKP
ncbi:uncharacterized protein LOC131877900 [Tigriopus californicus]|uniref:uncharacterized protein LOC131877900 n=1 Tax=Tigriopus californicus TaxID=6832 RepID=UPI0027DA9626|nr:uncharacterized protein LOC131877900 [Tigriopus californicus]